MNTVAFRFIGTTDDTTTCEHCGREQLKSTIILATLDADGNRDGEVYYGSTCAARAIKAQYGVKMTAAQVRDAAASAERVRRAEDQDARAMLDFYGLPLIGEPTAEAFQAATVLYAEAHKMARWANTHTDWPAYVRDMLARRQAQVIH
jgi:hypothetical protein